VRTLLFASGIILTVVALLVVLIVQFVRRKP
jgi:hypothetical protein